jgi:CheY-like chemotaxis protein
MDGKLHAASELGVGSAFTAELPNVVLVAALTPTAEQHVTLDHLAPLHIDKILIADDVPLNRELLVDLLHPHAGKVLVAADGEEALAVAMAEQPTLILMDVRMPRMDGREALEKLRAEPKLRDTPVIAVTASSMREQEIELRQQFDGYVRKPISVEALATEIVRVIGQRSAKSDTVPASPLQQQCAGKAASDKHWNELIAALQSIRNQSWMQARNSLAHRDVLEFVNAVQTLSDQANAVELRNFATRLRAATDRFDIVAMERELNHFPALITLYRNLDNGA